MQGITNSWAPVLDAIQFGDLTRTDSSLYIDPMEDGLEGCSDVVSLSPTTESFEGNKRQRLMEDQLYRGAREVGDLAAAAQEQTPVALLEGMDIHDRSPMQERPFEPMPREVAFAFRYNPFPSPVVIQGFAVASAASQPFTFIGAAPTENSAAEGMASRMATDHTGFGLAPVDHRVQGWLFGRDSSHERPFA